MGVGAVRLRVHFAPVGYEVTRIVSPLVSLRADAVILITTSLTGKPGHYHSKIIEALNAAKIPHETRTCDFWDVGIVVDEVGAIMAAAPQHEFFYNISTGSKTCAISGMISAEFWPLRIYYVPVDYERVTGIIEDDHPQRGPAQFLPTFSVPALDRASIVALSFLAQQPAAVPKRSLINDLREKKIIGPRRGKNITAQALQAQVDGILQRLQTWGFVETDGRGLNLRIGVTDKGKSGNKMFSHVLNPREAPAILRT